MPEGHVTFWDLLSRSIVIQSCLTLGLVGVTVYLYARQLPVPEGLQTLAYTVLAFWMGSKVQYSLDEATKTLVATTKQGGESNGHTNQTDG